MDKRVLMIVNPRAGKMKIRNSLYGAIEKLCSAGYEPTVVMTQYNGHASELSMRAKEYDLVICTGGDGTLNQVINGIIDSMATCPLGYIPLGSTNDFAGSLGIPNNVDSAIDIILSGRETKLDVASFNGRYFLDTAMFGVFSRASYDTPQDMKNQLGFLAYILEGIKDLPSIRTFNMEVCVDGEDVSGEYMLCAISNSNTLGGIIPLDKTRVDIRDGQFELIMAAKPQSALELCNMIRSLRLKDFACNGIVFRSGANMSIRCADSSPWTIDGEKEIWDGHADIQVIPGAVSFMLPDGLHDSKEIAGGN